MTKESSVKIVEVCKVSPSSNSSSKFSLPLAAFDWYFINFPTLQRVFYYSIIPHSDFDSDSDSFFNSILIPKLKHSLSLALNHFPPLAGNLIWPDDSPLPFILYSPNDAVSFTVAEADSDFHHVSSSHPREIKDSKTLVPEIQSSDDTAAIPIMAVQFTKFGNHGFTIGFAFHHVIFDGLSFSLFVKSWAHICKLNHLEEQYSFSSLPPEFTPSFERPSNVLQNPFDFVPKDRSFKHESLFMPPSNWLHGTFQLTPKHINNLKERVLEEIDENEEKLHLSTFVVAYAYVLICLIKAKAQECKEIALISLGADVRGMLNPPVSSNYFGNCVSSPGIAVEAREFTEDGFPIPKIAKKISGLIMELKRTCEIKVLERSGREEEIHSYFSRVEICSVAASPKFKLYQADFGWGNPKKIEIVSLHNNNISLSDTRDGDGGIEVGLVLPNHQMDAFASLFYGGLN